MFPIRDHNPSGRTPYVTYALIAVNVVVFLATLGIEQNSRALAQFYFDWAIIPARIEAGEGFYTLVSSMFLHAGFWHIAGNMLFLWIFGDNLEDMMGHLGFLVFYFAAGIGAGLAHVMMSQGSLVPTVGASGAIAGVMGGYLLLFPKAKIDILVIFIIFFKIFTIPAWIMLAIWFAMQFAGGLAADASMGGVAYWAHAGGFVIGMLLALPVFLAKGGPAFWNRTHGLPPHPAAQYDPSSIPTIRRRRR